MKKRLFAILVFSVLMLVGCGNSKLYKEANAKLEQKEYEDAIALYQEYKEASGDEEPLCNAYYVYAMDLYDQGEYLEAWRYLNYSDKSDSSIYDDVAERVYVMGQEYLEEHQQLMAFVYLGSVQDYKDAQEILPEEPLMGIWQCGNNYLKLTASSVSYMSSKSQMTTDEFAEDYENYLLILGDWKVTEEALITIDDHYLTHHNEHYLDYIKVSDNNTILVFGSSLIEGEYKRIIKNE
jgi:tetratricopeptide (TPR) repeat protein